MFFFIESSLIIILPSSLSFSFFCFLGNHGHWLLNFFSTHQSDDSLYFIHPLVAGRTNLIRM